MDKLNFGVINNLHYLQYCLQDPTSVSKLIRALDPNQNQKLNLTVTERAGSRLPKSSKMLITAEMSTIAQK